MFMLAKRRLDKDDPDVSAIVRGCMCMSEYYVPGSADQSIATIHHAIEHGASFRDTAHQYSRRAQATHPITAVQTELSLWSRDAEAEVIQTVRELGIGYVAYSPLGRGFLTDQIKSPDDFAGDDYRKNHPRFQGENFEKNIALVHEVEA